MAKRWPGIAIAADHPLTDYFVMKRRRGLRARRIPVGEFVWSAGWIGGVVTFLLLYPYYVSLLVLGLCLIERALHKLIFKKKVGEIAEPIDVLEERAAVKMEQLYLTPMRFSNLLGASAVVYYRHWKRYAAALALLLCAVMAFFMFVTKWYVSQRFPQFVWPIHIGLLVIFVAIGAVVCRRTFIVALGMRNLYAKLIEQTGRSRIRREGLVLEKLWLALPMTLMCSFVLLGGVRFFWPWLVILVSACVWECRFAARKLDEIVDEYYVRYVGDGEPYFQELFMTEEDDQLELHRVE
ncbi:hypothetical protein LLG95_00520 [bacterium]|nr:hypothetical protein [bacterium]